MPVKKLLAAVTATALLLGILSGCAKNKSTVEVRDGAFTITPVDLIALLNKGESDYEPFPSEPVDIAEDNGETEYTYETELGLFYFTVNSDTSYITMIDCSIPYVSPELSDELAPSLFYMECLAPALDSHLVMDKFKAALDFSAWGGDDDVQVYESDQVRCILSLTQDSIRYIITPIA